MISTTTLVKLRNAASNTKMTYSFFAVLLLLISLGSTSNAQNIQHVIRSLEQSSSNDGMGMLHIEDQRTVFRSVDCNFEIIINNPKCGLNDGLIAVVPADQDGQTIYFYELTDPDGVTFNNATFQDTLFYEQMATGDYQLTVTLFGMPDSCTADYDFVLEDDFSNCGACESEAIVLDASCGASNGQIWVAPLIQDGTPLEYVITGPEGSNSIVSILDTIVFGGLVPGTYTVTSSYPNEPELCTFEQTVEVINVDENCDFCNFFVDWVNPTCGLENGQVTITPLNQDGTIEYDYRLIAPNGIIYSQTSAEESVVYENLFSGEYEINIIQLDQPQACNTEHFFGMHDEYADCASCEFEINSVGPTCGENNGLISVTPVDQDGLTLFSYTLTDPNGLIFNDATVNSLVEYDRLLPGTYTINITYFGNDELCNQDFSVDLTNSDEGCTAPCEFEVISQNPTCLEHNGVIQIIPVDHDGEDIYSYQLTCPNGIIFNNATFIDTVVYQNLTAGLHHIQISLLGSDECTQEFEILLEDELEGCFNCEFTPASTNATCGDPNGSISITPILQDGSAFIYTLTLDGNEVASITTALPNYVFTDLMPGIYSLGATSFDSPELCSTSYEVEVKDTECSAECEFELIYTNPCGENDGLLAIVPDEQDGQTIYFYELTAPDGLTYNNATFTDTAFYEQLEVGDYHLVVSLFGQPEVCMQEYDFTLSDTECGGGDECEFELIFSNPSCDGENDGLLAIVPSIQDGQTIYFYELTAPDGLIYNNATFTDTAFYEQLDNGDYQLTVTLFGEPDKCTQEYEFTLFDGDACSTEPCDNETVTAGTISTNSNLNFCTIGDAIIDSVIVENTGSVGNIAYFITNTNGSAILAGPLEGPVFTMEGALAEVCMIVGVAYCGELSFPQPSGNNILDLMSTGTLEFTNSIAVTVYDCSEDRSPQPCDGLSAGSIASESTKLFCLQNERETVSVTNVASTGSELPGFMYVVTNEDRSVVLAGPFVDGSNISFEVERFKNYKILGIGFLGNLTVMPGQPLTDISSTGCYEFTNTLDVYAFNCELGERVCDFVQGGNIDSGNSLLEFCVAGDNQVDVVKTSKLNAISSNYAYIITDTDGTIVDGPIREKDFSFEGWAAGDYLIRGLGYEGQLTVPMGQNQYNITATGCYQFSNSIYLELYDCSDQTLCEILENGRISTESETELCVQSGATGIVNIDHHQNQSTYSAFIITNDNGMEILAGPFSDPNIAFDLSTPGTFRVRAIAYEGTLDVTLGASIAYGISSTECYEYTFSIPVTISDCGGGNRLAQINPFNDEIITMMNQSKEVNIYVNDFINYTCNPTPFLVDGGKNGTAELSESGELNYTPNNGFTGKDKITYMLCCGEDCKLSEINITVLPNDLSQIVEALYIPNVLTPNGDGINDVLEITDLAQILEGEQTAVLQVMDRNGQIVLLDTDFKYTSYWNGKLNNDEIDLAEGAYFYILQIMDGENVSSRSGFVELRR